MQPNLACSGPGRTGFIDFRVAPAVHASSSRELLGRARAADAGRSAAEGVFMATQWLVWALAALLLGFAVTCTAFVLAAARGG